MTYKYNSNEYTIVFVGQIYNVATLKEKLISKGFSFDTYSDTEILLKSYICFGQKVTSRLNGIFSFAIWDKNNKTIFIARDHLGIMPLYYCLYENIFLFSTDIKAILKHPLFSTNIAITNPLSYKKTNLHYSKTAFDNIYELSPANSLFYKERQYIFLSILATRKKHLYL